MLFRKLYLLLLLFVPGIKGFSQYGAMPPFSISIEAITGTAIPGIHSCAYAKSGDKWLFIGGRTNGLHGINSSGAFPPEYKNDNIIVVDTSTWNYYTADLNQLPGSIADPMRSTNMEFIQEGDYLYMAGGYGYDSAASMFVTFPKLTAVHVDNMIDAVINAQPIAPHIRQVSDTNMAVCGGDLGKIGSTFYLCFGHNFGGRYTDPPTPLFTQVYSNQIKKFSLTDDGTTITLSSFTYLTDTLNYHRRDLNLGEILNPDGSFGLEAFGGVFKPTENLPYREPITINAGGVTVNNSYLQVMSQYTCVMLPVYDSSTQTMYTTFLGGISLYDYNDTTSLVSYDSLVPFISDVTTLTTHPSGAVEETVLPLQLPGLLGSNAAFFFNENVSHYANEVIRIRDLPNTRILAGYMFGGIRAEMGNYGESVANDTIYRIYITPNNTSGTEELSIISNAMIFPNPAADQASLLFSLKAAGQVNVRVRDLSGKLIQTAAAEKMLPGNQKLNIDCSAMLAGFYICELQAGAFQKNIKFIIR
jgi:hypothetical protein